MFIIKINIILAGLILYCQAETEIKEARFDWSTTPQINCGSVYTCGRTAFLHKSSVRNQRCVWLYAIRGASKYKVVYNKFLSAESKKSVASILVPDSGILLSAFFAEKNLVDNHVLKQDDEFTVEGNVLLFTFWTNHFFTADTIIHFIEVQAVQNQGQVSPAATYSNHALFTPNMGHFRHPPKAEEILENVAGNYELSTYILVPPSNVVEFPLEQTTMKITLKRVSPAGGMPHCELQRVEFRTLNFSDPRHPAWTLRNEVCNDKPVASLVFYDVGIIMVRSIREQQDIRRGFEVFYTQ